MKVTLLKTDRGGIELPFPLNWLIGLPIAVFALAMAAVICLGVALILLSPILLIFWLLTGL
jgi:hypothetical protein